ncbi:MAG: NAD+ synthase [Flavobacteriales bacterium]|nr:NAD+ synthase [Flavobacteriales bacterium]
MIQSLSIRLCQLDYHIGNFAENTRKIIAELNTAKLAGDRLVVFPELAVCGYPPRDFLEFTDFIVQCEDGISEIARHCIGITAIVGAPVRNLNASGKRLHNAALVLANGAVKQVVRKTLLPTYDVFDEYRYFEPNTEFDIVEVDGIRIALTICEDLWNIEDPLYTISPMDGLMKQRPDLMVNIAASPFDHAHREDRIRVLSANCIKYGLPLLYCNHVGAQTELIFDGGSMALASDGSIISELNYFEEDSARFTVKVDENRKSLIVNRSSPILLSLDSARDDRSLPSSRAPRPSSLSKTERIHSALVLGISDYFRKLGFTDAVLGLSGGIDSAVVLCLAAEALGSEHVRTLLMPSPHSSQHSVDDAVQLSKNLGTKYDILPIAEAYERFRTDLTPVFGEPPNGLADENLQARIRGLLLMGVSNRFGNIVLNTSNKSEAAVGYGTIYGDMNGGLSVIGDLYKMEVYELAQHINRNGEVIPRNIITKPPSAELRPDQKDSDSLPDYAILDKILFLYIEERKGPKEIIALGHDEELVKRILRLVNINEYKRYQTPPTLRVSRKAFGMGRRMPIVGRYLV